MNFPEGWTSSALTELISFAIGGDWGKDEEFNEYGYTQAYCIRGSEFRNWIYEKGKTASLRKIKESSLQTRKLQKGDILLEISGGGPEQPVGRTVLIDDDVLDFEPNIPKICTNFLRLLRPTNYLNSAYLNFYLLYFYNTGEVVNYQGGSNNLRNLKFNDYMTISIPLAPLNEQQRIVAKLEAILAKVQSAKAHLGSIPELLKRTRQAILTAAVSGKLTEDWREENNLSFGEWEETTLGDVMVSSLYGPRFSKNDYQSEGIPTIRTTDIDDYGNIVLNDPPYISENIANLDKWGLIHGDLLVTRTGSIGKCAVYDDEIGPALPSAYLIRFRFAKEKVSTRFIFWFLMSPVGQELLGLGSTAITQPNINVPTIKSFPISLPSLKEQTLIVDKIQELFERLDRVDYVHRSVREAIDQITQSTLVKAFRGELVPQDPNDEPASVLLERIKAERALQASKPKLPKVRVINVRDSLNLELTDKVLDMVERKAKDLLEVLQSQKKPMQPEDLLRQAGYSDDTESIEEFYKQLKQYVKEEKISEDKRSDKKVLLSVGKK